MTQPDERELDRRARMLLAVLDRQAESSGYHLNPDPEMTLMLLRGLAMNIDRYGYPGCPCRLMSGNKVEDLDLICPCDYRDADVVQYGTCYCNLYVSKAVMEGKAPSRSIPERRLPTFEERKAEMKKRRDDPESAGLKLWRCKVCGYVCARESPPDECPVCFAEKARFERFKPPAPPTSPIKSQKLKVKSEPMIPKVKNHEAACLTFNF